MLRLYLNLYRHSMTKREWFSEIKAKKVVYEYYRDGNMFWHVPSQKPLCQTRRQNPHTVLSKNGAKKSD